MAGSITSINVSHYFLGNSQGKVITHLGFLQAFSHFWSFWEHNFRFIVHPNLLHPLCITFTETAAFGVWMSLWKAAFFTPVLYFGHAVSDYLSLLCLLFLEQALVWLPFLPSEGLSWFLFSCSWDWGSHFGEFKHLRLCLLIRIYLNILNHFRVSLP